MKRRIMRGRGLSCGVTLRDSQEIAVTGVGDGHDTEKDRSIRGACAFTERITAHPTRNSLPAAVPSATFVPAKWCTEVFESMA